MDIEDIMDAHQHECAFCGHPYTCLGVDCEPPYLCEDCDPDDDVS
jgi:hypothetical protein